MKQLELWPDDCTSSQRHHDETKDVARPAAQTDQPDDPAKLLTPAFDASALAPATSTANAPPISAPLLTAIEAGIFGMTLDGPIAPDREQIEGITSEHANEMITLLADSKAVEEAIRLEYDPVTGRTAATAEARQSLMARLDKEWKRLLQAYDDAIGAYADGFGDSAAKALDEWSERQSLMPTRKGSRTRLATRGNTFLREITPHRFMSTKLKPTPTPVVGSPSAYRRTQRSDHKPCMKC